MTARDLWTQMKASGFDEKKCLEAIREYGVQHENIGYDVGYKEGSESDEFHDEY